MTRRLDIELTSRTDGVWTWRAAGARLPKGNLDASEVPSGSSVGDVLRAEVESGIEGIEIISLAVKEEKTDEQDANRIELRVATATQPGVSVTYAPGARRRHEDGDRRPRRDGAARREGAPRRDGSRRPPRDAEGDGPRDAGAERGRRPERGRPPRDAEDAGRSGEGGRRQPDRTRRGPSDRSEGTAGPARHRERKPAGSTAHRNALLASLGPEQLPVAEELLRGGIPAVRRALADQRQPGTGAVGNEDAILAIAEELLPAVNLAVWKDRASTAQSEGSELRLRELRAVVAASRTVTLDDEGRVMARALREAHDKRVTAVRTEWEARITNALTSGRVLDALRSAQRPPDPGTRLPAELAVRMAEAIGAAMTADLDAAEWVAMLDAVVESAVRRTVRPAGIPGAPEAQEAARRAAGAVPALAKLLGLKIPPPPPPRATGVRRSPLTPAGGGGSKVAL